MSRLARGLHVSRRLWRRVRGRGNGLLAAWAALVVVIESVSRYSRSDVGDALGVLTLAVAASATVALHRRVPLWWLEPWSRGVERLGRNVRELGVELGFDLRETPPLERGAPPVLGLALGAAALLCGGALLGVTRWPEALRGISSLSYTLFLFTLGGLWAALTLSVFLCGALSSIALRDALLDAQERARRELGPRWPLRVPQGWSGAAVLLAGLVTALTLPPALAVALTVGCWGVALARTWTSRPRLDLVWPTPQRTLRALGIAHAMTATFTAGLFVLLTPLLFSVGDELRLTAPMGEGDMPITRALGRLAAWAVAGVALTLALHGEHVVRMWRAFRRAERGPRRLRVVGLEERASRRELARALTARGWRVRFDGRPDREALSVLVASDAPPAGLDPFGPSWPQRAQPEWLASETGLAALERHWRRTQRRRLVRALRTLFKSLAARDFAEGQGTFVAPHLWYATGLERDVREELFEDRRDPLLEKRIGARFVDVLPWSARAHAHEVLRALEVDLLFVEDGVGFRRLRRVLDSLFELYDVHGGAQRAEERHFTGLPGVTVVLVEIGLERTHGSTGYPEPDYEDLGRARILHVFRSRGGDVARDEAPSDVSWTPVSEWGPLLPTA
ncbi:MAG: hypothetical protein H6828_07005 [Planctomycetes bacterium]|nr:hypothetical protein [Planctomycetota bacterium]